MAFWGWICILLPAHDCQHYFYLCQIYELSLYFITASHTMIFHCYFPAGYAKNGSQMLTVVISGAEETSSGRPVNHRHLSELMTPFRS
jgi:hypothetical protein